jgi:hypothetical protein
MLRRAVLARTDVSEELSTSIRVTRIGELGTTLAVTSNRRTMRRNTNGIRNTDDSSEEDPKLYVDEEYICTGQV